MTPCAGAQLAIVDDEGIIVEELILREYGCDPLVILGGSVPIKDSRPRSTIRWCFHRCREFRALL